MSERKWTKEQLMAINTCDCNLLVAAAAGAGKTAVLVERLIRKITNTSNPIDVDSILVVTFTKAAAAEMRERIGIAIEKELNQNPQSKHLRRQATLLNKAAITNLHSFCLDILRKYFFRLDLDPSFRVADDTEAALIRQEAMDALFEDRYTIEDSSFINLVDSYGGERGDEKLQDMVLKLYHFAMSNPWPKDWLSNMCNNYLSPPNDSIDSHPWGRYLIDWINLKLIGLIPTLQRAIYLTQQPGGPANYLPNLLEELSFVEELISASDSNWLSMYEAINSFEFKKLKSCSKDVDENLKDQVKKIRDDVKKKLNLIKGDYFSRKPEDYLADLNEIAPYVKALGQLVIEFADKYDTAKAEKALVDFSDLEHFCLKVLLSTDSSPQSIIPSEVALELRENFNEVLVDEYQDINAVQELLLQLLSNQNSAPNLFMVGDVKQSIYRFRLAEPALFMNKYLSFPRTTGQKNCLVDLSKNFRSRKEVVDAVNFIFRQIMTPKVGEMAYDEKAELVYGANYLVNEDFCLAAGPVELHLLEKKALDPMTDEGTENEEIDSTNTSLIEDIEELDAIQREARLTAIKIKELIFGNEENSPIQVFDKNIASYRPLLYKDIVILMRATRVTANTYLDQFRQVGIPAYADLGTGYFDAVEVETMMSLLKVIDNPHQDIPLVAVLRSPLIGLKAPELSLIRLHAPQGDFFSALLEASQSEDVSLQNIHEKILSFIIQLEKWRDMARRGPLSDLIWAIYSDTGYYAYVTGMPGGAQRQANLRALHDRARQYESTNYRGLFRFLRFIEKFREKGSDLGTARSLGENEDVVRIMSIHKSKGLEFPVVFVTGLGKQFNTIDLRESALLHKELGLGLPVVKTDLNLTYPSIIQESIKKCLHMEMLAEEMRILYVAMTRAKEKLILIGSARNLDKSINSWSENIYTDQWALPDGALANAKTYLDWLVPALFRHRDCVTLRQCANINDITLLEDSSKWQVFAWPFMNFFEKANEEPSKNNYMLEKVALFEPLDTPGEYADLIKNRLNWNYPYQNIISKPAKVSVSELKRRFFDSSDQEEVKQSLNTEIKNRPFFLQQKTGLTPAEHGSAMHLVMQHIDLKDDLSIQGIKNQIDKFKNIDLLTNEQRDSINIESIYSFFSTPLGSRLINANSIHREIPFTMAIPAHFINSGLSSEDSDKVIVQGVIDCLFADESGLVLLDYKTDRIAPGEAFSLVDRYESQLRIYAMAVENILKKPVQEKYLYLFATGEAVLIK